MDKFLIKLNKTSGAINVSSATTTNLQKVNATEKCNSENGALNKNVNKNSEKSNCTLVLDVTNKSSGRKFLYKWCDQFTWINYDSSKNKVFCKICVEAEGIKRRDVDTMTTAIKNSYKSFCVDGFSSWNKALERFRDHEHSSLHVASLNIVISMKRGVNVFSSINAEKENQMKHARIALLAFISTLQYLTSQGLAIRGHSDESSNYFRLLKTRSEDIPELRNWLERNKYKWLSKDIANELINIMANMIQKKTFD